MKKLLIWLRVPYYNHFPCRFCYHRAKKYHPKRLPLHTISSPKSDMPASDHEQFISKGTIEHSSNCEFLLKIYHFLSFWKSLSSTKLTYTQTLSAVYALTLVLTRTSRKTHFRLWANLQITSVTMTYHRPMTGSVPLWLCPLMFSWHNPFYSHLALTIIITFVHLLQTQEISSGHNLQIYQKNRETYGSSKLILCEKHYAEQPWIKSICNN